MNGHLNGLQSKVTEAYPLTLFTHCYAHGLTLVLQQRLTYQRRQNINANSKWTRFFFPKSAKKRPLRLVFVLKTTLCCSMELCLSLFILFMNIENH